MSGAPGVVTDCDAVVVCCASCATGKPAIAAKAAVAIARLRIISSLLARMSDLGRRPACGLYALRSLALGQTFPGEKVSRPTNGFGTLPSPGWLAADEKIRSVI